MVAQIDESQLKKLLKEALVEVFEERKDILHELFTEVIEDIALVHAIDESMDSERVSREEIFNIVN